MTLTNVSEGMAVAAFQNGLSREGSRATKELLSWLMKYPPTTWDEIHNAYYAKVRADDDDFNGPTRWAHLEIVYALEKVEIKVKWPPKIRSDPSTRKSDAFCEFPYERGNKTEDCIALRQEVMNMLQKGHLKELLSDKGKTTFVRGRERQGPPKLPSSVCTINMIIGDNDDASINGIKLTVTHKLKISITHEQYDGLEESIIFDELDADGLTFPHNDALSITLRISDTDVKHIMVDDGSGACIIHP
ncbi:uncharacterized protein LOC107827680 [Nicotiana tabacum]|uniref:Uncharacterized protein LOC107827680 n=1 Tax=Nicotiana tabacum TaxID=4097 RepID=A0A1S4DAV9_TOBAC